MYVLKIATDIMEKTKTKRIPLMSEGSSDSEFFGFFKINLFIYLYIFGCIGSSLLRVGFLYLWQVGATLCCGVQASHCGGFSCCRAWALGTWASVVVAYGLSSCGSRALERSLSSCGARA